MIYNIFFSPTGGTKKAAGIITAAWQQPYENIDLITEKDKAEQTSFNENDVCFVSAPAYGGRVPSAEIQMLKKMQGNGAKAVLIATFGNRAIDDTMIELFDTLKAQGFVCIAGIEAVTEHSLARQFGAGRPDHQDAIELTAMSQKIKEAWDSGKLVEHTAFPGNRPYKKFGGVPVKPSAGKACIACGRCAKECPAAAIPMDDPKKTDHDLCISCMHCVVICPQQARHTNKAVSLAVETMLKTVASKPKCNKLYR